MAQELLVLTDEDGLKYLQCPRCHADRPSLVEVDRAIRWNRCEPEFDDGALVLAFGCGQADFEHARYQCGECDGTVALPHGERVDETWN